jgi:hypothetical protein
MGAGVSEGVIIGDRERDQAEEHRMLNGKDQR